MAITLNTLVKDGLGTVAKVIVIDSASSYKEFQQLIRNGSNLYPELSKEMKDFSFEVSTGKTPQEYKVFTKEDLEAAFKPVTGE